MIVECRNLTKNYGSFTAVNDVSFNIRSAECFGLLGPNGAGKSSLITTLFGASLRSSGELRVFGRDPHHESQIIKKQIGVVLQENCLDEALTVIENLRIFSDFMGVPREEKEPRINELLDFMALAHKSKSRIKELSGGMQRRLAFVRALLGKPNFLILDEPTTGLDPAVRHLLWDKISQLRRQGVTILLTTHYMDEAERLCDRLIIMDQGKIAATGSPRELIAKHCPGFVGSFEASEQLRLRLKEANFSHLNSFEDFSGVNIRADSIEKLTEIAIKLQAEPKMIRPSNLEDVFLVITGKELSRDA